jgi:hypothetical protein
MTTELQKVNPTAQLAFNVAPKTFDELWRFADMAATTALVPKQYQGRPADIFIAAQWGLHIGMHPIVAIQNICVINGRPSLYGDAMIALVRASGKLEYMKESWDEAKQMAICELKRVGEYPCAETFSMEDAKKAGLLGKAGPWSTYPKRMAKFRARGFALRDNFADVLGGLISSEEAQDMPVDVSVNVVSTTPAYSVRAESKEDKKEMQQEKESNRATNEDKDKFYSYCSKKGFAELITANETLTITGGCDKDFLKSLMSDILPKRAEEKKIKDTEVTPSSNADLTEDKLC